MRKIATNKPATQMLKKFGNNETSDSLNLFTGDMNSVFKLNPGSYNPNK